MVTFSPSRAKITCNNVQNAILAMSFNIAELAFHKSLEMWNKLEILFNNRLNSEEDFKLEK